MIGDRLAGAGEHERAAAEHGAQVNLQAAVAADVVERAPDSSAVGGARSAHRAVRPASACTTIFGTPVVPEVISTHSVCEARQRACAHRHDRRRATHAYGQARARRRRGRRRRRSPRRSTSAMTIAAPRCSAAASGGHRITMRRARPSSSISASALVSWLAVASNTERPASSAKRPPKLDPRSRSVKRMDAARSQRIAALSRSRLPRAATARQRLPCS